MYNNISSILQRSLYQANKKINISLERLATGMRINNAGDDAAGLAISTKLNTNIRGLNQAKSNVQTGINVVSTAHDALGGISASLQQLKDLSVQAATGTYSTAERQAFQAQADQIIEGIKKTQATTKFNGISLLEGGASSSAVHMTKEEALAQGFEVIESADDFVNKIADNGSGTAGKTYVLMGDIDMSTVSSYRGKANFAGTLDGNGHSINNSNRGLFETTTSSSVIKNLNLSNFNIGSGVDHTSPLAHYNAGTIDNVHISSSTISGSTWGAGGLVGSNTGTITRSSAAVTINATNGTIGGLVGQNSGTISKSSASANISGSADYVGGLVGMALSGSSITESFATGSVKGKEKVGGLVGSGEGSLHDSYSKVNVTGDDYVGGLWGYSDGTVDIVRNYVAGAVNGTGAHTGAIISENQYGAVGYNIFDKDIAGIDNPFGVNESGGITGANTGLSSEEMANKDNYGYFDQSLWDFEGGAPSLKWQNDTTYNPVNIEFQVGNRSDASSQVSVETSIDLSSLSVDFSSAASSRASMDKIDSLFNVVESKRSYLGAYSNIFESMIDSHEIKVENLTDAKSTIMSTDIAKETAELTKNQLLANTTNALMIQNNNNQYQLMLTLLGISINN